MTEPTLCRLEQLCPFLRLLAVKMSGNVTMAQSVPILIWITNSSIKLEQIVGDVDWAALAQRNYLPTARRTATRIQVLANGLGYSFDDKVKLVFLFGDTIGKNPLATLILEPSDANVRPQTLLCPTADFPADPLILIWVKARAFFGEVLTCAPVSA